MKRHPLDPVTLVFGLFFGIVGSALIVNHDIKLGQLSWLGALLPIAIGLALIGVSISRLLNNQESK